MLFGLYHVDEGLDQLSLIGVFSQGDQVVCDLSLPLDPPEVLQQALESAFCEPRVFLPFLLL